MSKPFCSSCSLSSTLQVSSKGLRTLQAIQFIWMGTNRLFRHFDMSKFCRHILWSIRHSLSFNLVSPGGPPSSYFMWKLYRVFIPVHFQLLQSWGSFVFTGEMYKLAIWKFGKSFTNSKENAWRGCPDIVCHLSQISQRINTWYITV